MRLLAGGPSALVCHAEEPGLLPGPRRLLAERSAGLLLRLLSSACSRLDRQ
jgi:hypothetical protein